MRLLRLLFLLAVLAAGSCRRAEPPPRAVLAAGDIVVELAETLPRGPAAWVNEREIPAASVEELARARGWPRARALRVLVDAALVTDEAARMGRGCTTPGAPDACAQELLEALYSEETVCRHIPEGEVDRAYQEAFDRDWPVEAYAGWVAEKRCCGGGDGALGGDGEGDCDPPEAAACRAGLDRWLPTFGALSAAWAAGEDPAQSAARLLPPAAGVRVADFFFTYWPEEGPDGQPRLESWDPAMLAEVISLPEGGVSRPLRSSMGIHVFRLDRYKPAKLASDPAVRDALRKRICSTRVQEIRDRYVRDLRAAAAVRLPASD